MQLPHRFLPVERGQLVLPDGEEGALRSEPRRPAAVHATARMVARLRRIRYLHPGPCPMQSCF